MLLWSVASLVSPAVLFVCPSSRFFACIDTYLAVANVWARHGFCSLLSYFLPPLQVFPHVSITSIHDLYLSRIKFTVVIVIFFLKASKLTILGIPRFPNTAIGQSGVASCASLSFPSGLRASFYIPVAFLQRSAQIMKAPWILPWYQVIEFGVANSPIYIPMGLRAVLRASGVASAAPSSSSSSLVSPAGLPSKSGVASLPC